MKHIPKQRHIIDVGYNCCR